ncbi:MAG TPA: aminoacyl-tRNA hydrolase, partial [Rhodothermales bacterium]|nr:aminoacyl-tRNA hydrolase [Rhodothermales bacterium]
MSFLSRLFRSTPPPVARARRIIVGLGNPGRDYADTRHNVGFWVAERAAERARAPFGPDFGRAKLAEGSWRGVPFAVGLPQTYMNRSGESAVALLRRYGLEAGDILVVVDDLALDPGVLRLRPSGSDGGHHGLSDIADALDTDQFPRLRVGIGKDFPRGRQADYVLQPFTAEQRLLIDAALPTAADAALTFIA